MVALGIELAINKEGGSAMLKAYLGQEPSELQAAKFYLMKQVVLIKWACGALRRINSADIHRYAAP